MSVAKDMYMGAVALPALPGEHTEAIEVDFATHDGGVVILRGRVTMWEQTRSMFVDVDWSVRGFDRFAASAALQHAVRHRLIGSDKVRSGIERGFTVRGLEEVKQ